MAILVETSNASSVEPKEILEWCESHVDPLDEDSILGASDLLYSLQNNRAFVTEAIGQELRHLGDPTRTRQVSPQSLFFDSAGAFAIRVNIWSPPDAVDSRSRAHQDEVFSYLIPHDHNFGLLTVGYAGRGYTTVVHEYDADSVEGYAGERVALRELGTTTLSRGRILYYRPSRDIHAQLHPQDVSISVNLLVEHARYRSRPQFEFDIEQRRIVGLLRGTSRLRQTAILDFIDLLGCVDDETMELLSHVAVRHEAPNLRAAAYNTLANHRPLDTRHLAQSAFGAERSEVVRSEMLRILEDTSSY